MGARGQLVCLPRPLSSCFSDLRPANGPWVFPTEQIIAQGVSQCLLVAMTLYSLVTGCQHSWSFHPCGHKRGRFGPAGGLSGKRCFAAKPCHLVSIPGPHTAGRSTLLSFPLFPQCALPPQNPLIKPLKMKGGREIASFRVPSRDLPSLPSRSEKSTGLPSLLQSHMPTLQRRVQLVASGQVPAANPSAAVS